MVIKRVVAIVVLALAAVSLYVWSDRDADTQPTASAAEPAPRPLSQLEREATARFAGSQPRIKLPDGTQVPPRNEEHALAIKVRSYKNLLVQAAEARDPTFKLKAEAELERRQPRHATITWEDVSGNQEMLFVVEDSSECGLPDGATDLQLSATELSQHPCLAVNGSLGGDVSASVHLEPVGSDEALWQELLRDTLRSMAAEAHLASNDSSHAL
jgi:hypothetical protein